jgi:hypothetical protein
MTKFVVVLPIRPLEVGVGFTVGAWPLHVTLVPRFSSAVDVAQLATVLQATARGRAPIDASIGCDAYFGTDSDILVSLVADQVALVEFHLQLLSALERECGITVEEPQYSREGFRPHVTAANEGRIREGEKVGLVQIALVEMSPQSRSGIHSVVVTVNLERM